MKKCFILLIPVVVLGILFTGCGPKSPSRPIAKGLQSTLSESSNGNFHTLILCRPWKFVNSGVYSAFMINDTPAVNFKSGFARFDVKPGKHFVTAYITDYGDHKWGKGIVVETKKDRPTIVVFNASNVSYREDPDFPYGTLTAYQPENPVIKTGYVCEEDLKLAAQKAEEKSKELAEIKAYQAQMDEYIRKKNLSGLKAYVNQNPRAAYYISDNAMRLLFVGPENLQVGDIITYKKKNISDILLISKIKSSKTPYKLFSMDEILILQDYNISDAVIAAMIDVTTEIVKEMERDEKQRKYLEAHREFMKQKESANQNLSSPGSQLGKQIGQEISKQMVKSLLDQLF